MTTLLSDTQLLLFQATQDYKQKVWKNTSTYVQQFNALLKRCVAYGLNPTVEAITISNASYEHSYAKLADRITLNELVSKCNHLLDFLDELDICVSEKNQLSTLSIEHILHRFPMVIRQLHFREDDALPFEVKNTQDVIYILKALLMLYTTSLEITNNQLFFPSENTLLVAFKTDTSFRDAQFEQEIQSIYTQYVTSAPYKKLIYFLYDPEFRIFNPSKLQTTIHELSTETISCELFILPLS